MKKTLFAILLCGFMVMGLTGCIKENNDDDKKSYENNDECCESCMCGDTIELLKTTEEDNKKLAEEFEISEDKIKVVIK